MGVVNGERETADLSTCFHEAAHVIVDLAFGHPVTAVWVLGEEGMVEVPPLVEPDDSSELARHYWGHLCATVAGDLGEFLCAEISDADDGEWPTHEERIISLGRQESLLRALAGKPVYSPGTPAPRYPAGELGLMFRYAIMVTGRLLPVTAELWWGICGNSRGDTGPAGPNDASLALRLAGRLSRLKGMAARPFGNEWPADEIDADGLFAEFHLIRYAEVEVEQILKREWASVHAVATSLYRRKNHRMTGRQVEALLRRRDRTPPTPSAASDG